MSHSIWGQSSLLLRHSCPNRSGTAFPHHFSWFCPSQSSRTVAAHRACAPTAGMTYSLKLSGKGQVSSLAMSGHGKSSTAQLTPFGTLGTAPLRETGFAVVDCAPRRKQSCELSQE